MSPELEVIARIMAPLVSGAALAIWRRITVDKANVETFTVQAAGFTMKPDPASSENQVGPSQAANQVNTHTIVVRNTGRRAAHNVRIGHTVLPIMFQLIPAVAHSVVRGQDNSAEIQIPILVAKEQITISYLYFPPLYYNNIHSYVKSDEGIAKVVNVIPSERPSKIALGAVFFLAFLGLTSVLYWSILLGMYLLKIPGAGMLFA